MIDKRLRYLLGVRTDIFLVSLLSFLEDPYFLCTRLCNFILRCYTCSVIIDCRHSVFY